VKPNELQLEQPYIGRNIASTREAYNLRNIVVKPFTANQSAHQPVAGRQSRNDRQHQLWDRQPLLDTYAQLQESAPITNSTMPISIAMCSALVPAGDAVGARAGIHAPSANAQTWVNLHVLFTHGNGVVMSPVTRTSPEGPCRFFYLRDIPPVTSGGPPVGEPRIYFGEGDAPYVIVKSSTPEFDYPMGNDNVYRAYNGADGVSIGGVAGVPCSPGYFGDSNILLSQYVTAESRIMFRRNIQERVSAIAPFLGLDHDPYIVGQRRPTLLDPGRLHHQQLVSLRPADGGRPDELHQKFRQDRYRCLQWQCGFLCDRSRRSDRRDLPAQCFPRCSSRLLRCPPICRNTPAYPEDLFLIQAQIYRAYHMNRPEVFYNREDLWQFPRQPNGIDDTSDSKMSPYYINMRLPGETHTEFVSCFPWRRASAKT